MAYYDTEPARTATLAVKHDTNVQKARSLWVGTAGTLNFVDSYGNTVSNFPAKEGLNPIIVTKILTGGTADNIWLLS